MKKHIIDIKLNDHVAMSCMKDRLTAAIDASCTKEPDSLGDRLFNAKLAWSFADRTGGPDAALMIRVCDLLNEFEAIKYAAKYADLPHISLRVYRFVKFDDSLATA